MIGLLVIPPCVSIQVRKIDNDIYFLAITFGILTNIRCHVLRLFCLSALNLLESMEWTVDPCEDFYAFTCGGWMLRNPADSSAAFTDHFAKINYRVIQATQRESHQYRLDSYLIKLLLR